MPCLDCGRQGHQGYSTCAPSRALCSSMIRFGGVKSDGECCNVRYGVQGTQDTIRCRVGTPVLMMKVTGKQEQPN